MGEIISEVNYKETIQNINASLRRLSFGKAIQDMTEIELAQQDLNNYAQIILANKEASAIAIKKHYNQETYNLNNGNAGATPYLKVSIIREIIQNIIDCKYEGNEIGIFINFDDEQNTIEFDYNEEGFTISNVISFLSLDNTSKDSNNTGAFGLGAKGTILNVESMKIKSYHTDFEKGNYTTELEICHKTNHGRKSLFIEELLITDNIEEEKGTRLTMSLNPEIYEEIKKNLYNLTGEKEHVKYINPIDLMFASLKQPNKMITIHLPDKSKVENEFSVYYDGLNKQVNFLVNAKHKVGVKVFESLKSNFSYLIPYNRNTYEGSLPDFITRNSYNYFSTYELTGVMEGKDLNLPKFFINLPTIDKDYEHVEDEKYYITDNRKGINENKKIRVEELIAEDFLEIIEEFKNQLIITYDESGKWTYRYILSYLYEFLEYQMKKSIPSRKLETTWRNIEKKIKSKININFQDKLVPLKDIRKYKYSIEAYNLAKDLKENYFVFKSESINFKQVKFTLKIGFDFVILGNNTIYYELADYSECRMEDYGFWSIDDYKNSDNYKSALIGRIFNSLNYQDSKEIILISAEADREFTETTLLKLLKAIDTDSKIQKSFDNESNSLYVGEKQYQFTEGFSISEKETLYYAYKLNKQIGKGFFDLICKLYKNYLFHNQEEWSLTEKISLYKKYNFKFKLLSNSDIAVHIYYEHIDYTDYNRSYNIPIEEELDLSKLSYEEIVHLTGLIDYKILKNREIDKFSFGESIIDFYNLNLDILNQYSNVRNTYYVLDKIIFGITDLNLGSENLIAFVKDGIFEEIILLKDFKNIVNINDYDYILIIPKINENGSPAKINKPVITNMLDILLNANGKIKSFYRNSSKPLVKMLDQFDYKLKPVLDVKQEEVEVLKEFLNVSSPQPDNYKLLFAKDLTHKLYGYSTCCSLCNYKTDVLNAFNLKEIEYLMDGKEYKLPIYVCSNHSYEVDSWIILDIEFQSSDGNYKENLSNWVDIINEKQSISSNLLKCKLQIVKKSSYQLFDINSEDDEQISKWENYYLILTPLMAVKWWLILNNK